MRNVIAVSILGFVPVLLSPQPLRGANQLAVHEWGTFTSLQDESGEAIGGINTDDEPVPEFVWELKRFLLIKPGELAPIFYQGAPHCHPQVTMRLETPVVYFHPPPASAPLEADVDVEFHGGWLTQYYPNAEVDAPGLESREFAFGPLGPETTGRLMWRHLKIGVPGAGPPTTAPVWTSPRAVDAAEVTTFRGESERFLFYRGVGRLNAPLRVSQEPEGHTLSLRSQIDPSLRPAGDLKVSHLWLADIRADGAVAFRSVDPVTLKAGDSAVLATAPAGFEANQYAAKNLETLRAALREALTGAGLNADEANALLNTWQTSYFKSPGERLFFLVPRAWTDGVLPLSVSTPADITRVMVGRIELVSPAQRTLLKKIAAGPASDNSWYWKAVNALAKNPKAWNELWQRVADEGAPASELGQPLPEDYRAYLALGRFRNALLLDEAQRRPTDALKAFIANYDLHAFELPAAHARGTP